MIHLYGRHTSYNVQKVLWALRELELPFQHTNLGGAYGGLDTQEFAALNPNRKVPVLVDGEAVIWESHAIVRHLARNHGVGTLWPDDPVRLSQADQWMEWSVTSLLPAFIGLFWGYYRTPEAERDEAQNEKFRRRCERLFGMLDERLADQDFLVGDTLTMADIPVGSSMYRYLEMGLGVPRPANLMAWYERLLDRAPYRDAVVEPFDELFGRLAY